MPGPLWKLSRAKPVDLKKLCKSVPACLMFKKLRIQSMTVTSYNQVNDMRKSNCWIDTVNCGRGVVMKTITIGSDCSGLGTDCVAVERLGLKFVNMFSSDTDVHCRDVLEWFLVSIDWVISIGNKSSSQECKLNPFQTTFLDWTHLSTTSTEINGILQNFFFQMLPARGRPT